MSDHDLVSAGHAGPVQKQDLGRGLDHRMGQASAQPSSRWDLNP
ncbi:hypothetical protein [Streptomyces sp. BH055]